MFYFNEFAFTVQVKRKINRPSIQILGFILICLYFTTGRFHTCVLCKECSLFAFSWLSFQRLCRLLWGLQSVDNTLQSAVPLERYPVGTKAQQNENMCPIRSKKASFWRADPWYTTAVMCCRGHFVAVVICMKTLAITEYWANSWEDQSTCL